ncbi:MAG: carbamate kinase [Clostridia bacterium]|nr:carbamate kinase [Clostridia bacterium]
MARKIVVALGGNALGLTPEAQKEAVGRAVQPLVALIRDGYRLAIVHGNGPQVGLIHLAFEQARQSDPHIPAMPFAESTAMSQGYIGFHLQNALKNALHAEGLPNNVSTVVTQVVVDPADPAFSHPTKPVGLFYSQEEARRMTQEQGHVFVEDSGRGYRRVVPSPEPVDIVEKGAIQRLMKLGDLVIACGGGGIPVSREDERLVSLEAVIDKDKAAALLAELTSADLLLLLTAVPYVALHYGKPNQIWVDHLTTHEVRQYIDQGQFAAGSMLPKIEAALKFNGTRPGRETIIASLENAYDAVIAGKGTRITL